MVHQANEQYEADCLGWRNVISSAHNLLTCRDLDRFGTLCNDRYDAYKVSITSTSIGSHRSLDPLPTFGSGMGLRVTRRTKRAMTKAGVVATNPMADVSTSSHITSGLGTLSGSNSVRKRRLVTANSRYVRMQLFFIALF
jgi:hypothetical protein